MAQTTTKSTRTTKPKTSAHISRKSHAHQNLKKQPHHHKDPLSTLLRASVFVAITLTGGVFVLLVGYILYSGLPHLSASLFEWKYTTQNVSMLPALINTITIVALSLLCSAPVAILGAVYLQEYAKSDSWIVGAINLAAETLAGIPSIVYGLFGFIVFVMYAFDNTYTMLAGAFTLSIMVLPLILRNTQEALKCVPVSYKEAGFGLGAPKLVVLFKIILPCAMSGVLAGVILAIGRIISESAALLYTAGSVAQVAGALDSGRTLSVHLYQLLNEGLYIEQAAASAVVILLIVIMLNILSNVVAKKLSPSMPA